MAELQFTEEEQAYLDAEQGVTPVKEEAPPPEEKPAPAAEQEEEPAAEAEGAEDEGEDVKEQKDELPKGSPQETIRTLRAKARAQRDKIRDLETFMATAQERLDALQQFRIKAEAPDPEMDPEGHARYQERIQQEQAQAAKEAEKTQAEQQAKQSLYQHVSAQETAFATAVSDYYPVIQQAKAVLIEAQQKTLMDLDVDEETAYDTASSQVEAYLEQRAQEITAIRGNFPKWAYTEAKKILEQIRQPQAQAQEQKAQPEKKDTSELKQIAAGQQAARNPKASGKSKGLTLEELVSMETEEFLKYAGDEKLLRRLMGE